MIHARTPWVWVIGRTQTNGPADYPAVAAMQDGLQITPLSPAPAPPVDPDYDTTTEPLTLVNSVTAVDFFSCAASVLVQNPPYSTDFSTLARIAHLGIIAGGPLDTARFTAADLADIEASASPARAALLAALPALGTKVNGWTSFSDTATTTSNALS